VRVALLALTVFVALVLGSIAGPGAFGDPQEKIDRKLDELDRIQSSTGSLREQIDAMNARVDDLIGRESVLRQQESALEAELAEKQAELDKATAELNAQKAELARVRAELDRAVAALEQLLVQIYMSHDPDLTAVVLRSSDWSDLLTRTEYVEHLRSYDEEVVTQVRGLRDRITALVEQLQATRDRIQAARDEVAAKERELDARRLEISSQRSELAAAKRAREGVLQALLEKERQIVGDLSNIPPPAGQAVLAPNGDAIPPSNAPLQVRAVIDAANQINEKPYVWGGGHGSFEASGYDCSGAVSFALHGGGFLDSPLDSSGFMTWASPGGGRWITIFTQPGHMFAVIAGLRFDTGGPGGGNGPRWSTVMRSDSASYNTRHPPGF
jgi:peptidoglycan hydrolase CwlO-like protein